MVRIFLWPLLIFLLLPQEVFSAQSAKTMVTVGIYENDPFCSDPDHEQCLIKRLLAHVAESENWQIRLIPGTPGDCTRRLLAGELDLILAVPFTDADHHRFDFTRETIISTWAQVFTIEDRPIHSFLDLDNKHVGVLKEDLYNREVREITKRFAVDCIFIEFGSYDLLFEALENGWVDVVVADRLYGAHNRDLEKIKGTSVVFSPQEYRFASLKSQKHELLAALSYHIEKAKNDTASFYYDALRSVLTPEKEVRYLRYLKWGLITTVMFLVISSGMGMMLRLQVKRKTAELSIRNAELKKELKQRRHAETEREKSEARYRSVFENTGTATIILESDMTISMVNDRAARLCGYEKEAIENRMKVTDFIPSEEVRSISEYHRSRRKWPETIPSEYESRIITRDQQILDVFLHVSLIPGTSKSIVSITDITERKRIENERLRLVTALEQSSEIIFVTDENRCIQYVNPAFEQAMGYERDEVLGRVPSFLWKDEKSSHIIREIGTKVAKGKVWEGRLTNRAKDGSLIETFTTITPVRDSSQKITEYVYIKHDLTSEVAMEKKLIQAQKLEAVGQMAGGIAHDFNNILASLMGYTELSLADPHLCEKTRSYLDTVLTASKRASELVKQILAFSRQTDSSQKTLRLVTVVKEAAQLLRAVIPTTVAIKLRLEDDGGQILADPTQIHQILMNLGTNAAHAMQQGGGELKITLKQLCVDQASSRLPVCDLSAGDYLELTVADTGHGMDAATKEKVFDPFFSTKHRSEGTGLGLSVVHGIVKAHNGQIHVQSRPGRGTVFSLIFPCIAANRPVSSDLTRKNLPSGVERVLFVDDDEILADMAGKMISGLGYRATVMTDSSKALSELQKRPLYFDLLITDQTMPGLTGTELAQQAMALSPDLPVVLCTGYSEVINPEKAHQKGIHRFVYKPVSRQQLAVLIREVLDSRALSTKPALAKPNKKTAGKIPADINADQVAVEAGARTVDASQSL